jgi:hypothetical protein
MSNVHTPVIVISSSISECAAKREFTKSVKKHFAYILTPPCKISSENAKKNQTPHMQNHLLKMQRKVKPTHMQNHLLQMQRTIKPTHMQEEGNLFDG